MMNVSCEDLVPCDGGDGEGGDVDGDMQLDLDADGGPAALHCAVFRQDVAAVERLLAAGVDPDEPDWSGCGDTAIIQAVESGNLRIVRSLCAAGCSVNARRVNGQTALLLAVVSRASRRCTRLLLSLLEELLSARADADVREKLRGQAPLHALAKAVALDPHDAHLARAFRLLSDVADVNVQDHRKRTPLHHLAVNGCQDPEPYKILLERGADASLQNSRGETALVEYLERDCAEGPAEGVLRLLSVRDLVHGDGAGSTRRSGRHHPLRRATQYGETALHVAARRNLSKAVEVALAAGANPQDQDLRGNTALHLAASRGYQDVVSLLLAAPGVQVNAANRDGFTALHVAVESGFVSVVNMLLCAEEVDVSALTGQGQSVLDLAQQEYRRRAQPELAHTLARELDRRFSLSLSSTSSTDLWRSSRSTDTSSAAGDCCHGDAFGRKLSQPDDGSPPPCRPIVKKTSFHEDVLVINLTDDSKLDGHAYWDSEKRDSFELSGERMEYLGLQMDRVGASCPDKGPSLVDMSLERATRIIKKLRDCETMADFEMGADVDLAPSEVPRKFRLPVNPYATMRTPRFKGLDHGRRVGKIDVHNSVGAPQSSCTPKRTAFANRWKSVEAFQDVDDGDFVVESLLAVAKSIKPSDISASVRDSALTEIGDRFSFMSVSSQFDRDTEIPQDFDLFERSVMFGSSRVLDNSSIGDVRSPRTEWTISG